MIRFAATNAASNTAGVAAVSVLTAPYGAKLAHKLPVATLKRFFAVFLLAMATRMLWSMF